MLLKLNEGILGYNYNAQSNIFEYINSNQIQQNDSSYNDSDRSSCCTSEQEQEQDLYELSPTKSQNEIAFDAESPSFINSRINSKIENNEEEVSAYYSPKFIQQPNLLEEKQLGTSQILFLKSIYQGRPPTIFFQYHPSCEKIRDTRRCANISLQLAKKINLKYKAPVERPFQCVVNAFEIAGFKPTNGRKWNGFWGGVLKDSKLQQLNNFQHVNHIPGCFHLGRKDNLWRHVGSYKRKFPEDYKFLPQTYLLKYDYERFKQVREDAKLNDMWILKPVASSCGRGIHLINKNSKLNIKKSAYLAQKYIQKTHLLNEYKYDLRIYVLISSIDPLRIYIYENGLVRFATQKYQPKLIKQKEQDSFNLSPEPNLVKNCNKYTHLTNYSVNKKNIKQFVSNQNADKDDGSGSKWTLQALKKKFNELNIEFEPIWEKIKDLVIKTIIAGEPFFQNSFKSFQSSQHKCNCFELFGFDIILDYQLKPWLLEVNVSPSLSSTSPLDRKIKYSLLSDIQNLIGYRPFDKKKFYTEKDLFEFNQDGQQFQKTYSKSIIDLKDLSIDNCISKLNEEDWRILLETDDEFHRKGMFERIFPIKAHCLQQTYDKYFEVTRYNNVLLAKWLISPNNFIEKIFNKIYHFSV